MKNEQAPDDTAFGGDPGIALRLRAVLPELTSPPSIFERVERHVLKHKIEIPLAAVAMSATGVILGAAVATHNRRLVPGH